MIRPGRRCPGPVALAALTLVVAVVAGACATSTSPTPGPVGPVATASTVAPAGDSPGPSAEAPESPLTGVLVDIDASGLSQVTGFRLRLDDGRELAFRIGILENGVEFPPGHLAEHLATSAPVRVFFRPLGADLVVYRLEDAS